jgi:hypothetical protein
MWYQAYWGAVGATSNAMKEVRKLKRLRMTKAERKAVEHYIGTGGPVEVDKALARLLARHATHRKEKA